MPNGFQNDDERAARQLGEITKRKQTEPGVKEAPADADVTSPIALIDPERYQVDDDYRREQDVVVERYRRDPAYRALWMRAGRAKHDTDQLVKRIANEKLKDHQDAVTSADLAPRVQKIETSLGLAKWLMGFLVAAVLGSVITVFTKVYSWGMSTGEVEIRLQHLERDLEQLQQQAVRRQSSIGWSTAPMPTTASTSKGTTP